MQDTKLGFVVNALYTVAHALRLLWLSECAPLEGHSNNSIPRIPPQECISPERLNGSKMKEYLRRVNFSTPGGNLIHFDSNGDPPARLEFFHFDFFAHSNFTSKPLFYKI